MKSPVRTHECQAKGCDRQVPLDVLTCRTHWFRIPYYLRNEVISSYRATKRINVSESDIARYRIARAAALAAIEEKDIPNG